MVTSIPAASATKKPDSFGEPGFDINRLTERLVFVVLGGRNAYGF
jgi:hypothetical protein